MREKTSLNPGGGQETRRYAPDSAKARHGQVGQSAADTESGGGERSPLGSERYWEG